MGEVLMENSTKGYTTVGTHGTPGHKSANTESDSALLTGLMPEAKKVEQSQHEGGTMGGIQKKP